MSRKAFLVEVELDIQAITCPGVWLCSNGQVSLQVYMLDSCVQTTSRKPIFPILCHEKFVFYKTYYTKHRLIDLQRQMGKEWLYIEFIQWQSCELGNVLSTFQTTLDELLFPSTYRGSESGADVDLLMEPTKVFPGTIAPKIELSTKTTIEETICNCNRPSSSTVVVNPKMLISSHTARPKRTRRVCHSIAYSRQRKSRSIERKRPPFRYRKAEDDLISRRVCKQPENSVSCKCQNFCGKLQPKPNCTKWAEHMIKRRLKMKCQNTPTTRAMQCPCAVKRCSCGASHMENACPVCAKYKGYFKQNPPSHLPQPQKPVRSSLYTDAICVPRYVCNKTAQPCNCGNSEGDKQEKLSSALRTICHCSENSDDGSGDEKSKCLCNDDNKQSLAEKIHERLAKTLSYVPNYIQGNLNENLCGCTNAPVYSYPQQYGHRDTQCQKQKDDDNDSNNNITHARGCPLCNYCNCIS